MADPADLGSTLARHYDALAAGNFAAATGLLEALDAREDPQARAHAAAIRAMAWFADEPYGEAPELERLAQLVDAGATEAARFALLVQRERLCAFDGPSMAACAELAGRLTPAGDAGRARIDLAVALAGAVTEPTPAVGEALRAIYERAHGLGLADVAVDAQTALAMAFMRAGDLEEATKVARRASRMARTEALPQQEYLAHLLLARVRRLNGVPHLSTHISSALAPIASAPYQPWLRWERLLAGAPLADPPERQLWPSERATLALERMMAAAGRGDGAALARARADLETATAGFPFVLQEALDFAVALDPTSTPDQASEAMQRWLFGEEPLPPHGLYGPQSTAEGPDRPADTGFLVAGPGRRARRVLGAAAALADFSPIDDDAGQRRRARTETGLAVLALESPEPLELTSFFRQVYGFEHDPAVHTAVLNTLVSRMRTMLGDGGVIDRGEDSIAVRFTGPLTLPDPRCGQPLEDRVLRMLVRAQAGTAKEAAERLGLPLRRIQEALKELTAEGACSKQRSGRSIAYVVEDTTFSPPTVRTGLSRR